jgi:hypothetical protein
MKPSLTKFTTEAAKKTQNVIIDVRGNTNDTLKPDATDKYFTNAGKNDQNSLLQDPNIKVSAKRMISDKFRKSSAKPEYFDASKRKDPYASDLNSAAKSSSSQVRP